MKVTWTEYNSYAHDMAMDTFYPDADFSDFTSTRTGEIVGTHGTFWGDTVASVMCDDGKIREVSTSQLKKA